MVRWFSLFGWVLALSLTACGGDGGSGKKSSSTSGGDDVIGPGGDGKTDITKRPEHPDSEPGECNCWPDEICQPDTGECVPTKDLPEGDLYGEVELLNQAWPDWNEEPIGTASARFFYYETPPRLQEYYTDDGEICVVYDYSSSSVQWPKGQQLDAGEVSFEVDTAPGPIVVEPMSGSSYGTIYGLKNGVLPPAPDNVGNHFSADYVPLGRSFTVTAAGGSDIGAFTFDAGQMPDEFTVADGEEYDNGIEVHWSPAQPSAKMEIISTSGEVATVCTVKDDGSARVPFFLSSVQLRRVTERLATIDVNGKEMQLLVIARHAWLGKLEIGKSSGR